MIRLASLAILFLTASSANAAEITARETLPRGTILSADLVDISGTPAASQEDIFGKELKRAVYKGYPVRLSDVREPLLVKRNATVRMTYAAGPLFIHTQGRAMEQGSKGEIIAVLNLSSRARVYATVTDNNTVEVSP